MQPFVEIKSVPFTKDRWEAKNTIGHLGVTIHEVDTKW